MTDLKAKIRKALSLGKRTIPSLCRAVPEVTNEFKMMRLIAEMEEDGSVVLEGFDRIYREDGGAIYLAEYALS